MVLSEDEKPVELKRGRKNIIYGWSAGLILLALLGSFIGVRLADSASRSVTVPSDVVQAFAEPIYLPAKLPGKYQIDEKSFGIQEDVLVFQAKDGAGGTIVFTQQPKPKDFNFQGFYDQHLKNAKTVNDVPYPSVAGESTVNNSNVLSIVTDDTWIIANTQSSVSPEDLEIAAKSIKRYQE